VRAVWTRPRRTLLCLQLDLTHPGKSRAFRPLSSVLLGKPNAIPNGAPDPVPLSSPTVDSSSRVGATHSASVRRHRAPSVAQVECAARVGCVFGSCGKKIAKTVVDYGLTNPANPAVFALRVRSLLCELTVRSTGPESLRTVFYSRTYAVRVLGGTVPRARPACRKPSSRNGVAFSVQWLRSCFRTVPSPFRTVPSLPSIVFSRPSRAHCLLDTALLDPLLRPATPSLPVPRNLRALLTPLPQPDPSFPIAPSLKGHSRPRRERAPQPRRPTPAPGYPARPLGPGASSE